MYTLTVKIKNKIEIIPGDLPPVAHRIRRGNPWHLFDPRNRRRCGFRFLGTPSHTRHDDCTKGN